MIGLDYIMAGYVTLASGQIKCEIKKSPELAVTATDTALKIDNSKSKAELNQFDIDTVSPYGRNAQVHVGGLMSGEIKTSSNVSIMSETYPALNAACLLVNKITVKIHVDPTIYIAREYKRGSCMYASVLEHEQKHVRTDRILVNKYTGLIAKALDAEFRKTNYAFGPVRAMNVDEEQRRISHVTSRIVKDLSEKMNEERRILQQKIDTLEEYNRVSNACKGRT